MTTWSFRRRSGGRRSRRGMPLRVGEDGQKALSGFRTEDFDLLALDTFVDRFMDGHQMVRRIVKRRPDVPIIMTSGRRHTADSLPEADYRTMVMKLAAVSALPKQFKPATLLALIADGLASASPAGNCKPGHDALPNS
ncbi:MULTISPECIES: response regulator [unclassified Bradyrhizobium]|uniref:response regulator n=2 Tax=unclassified Bradyrhizobium TaxID=2631580 RepID=UPI0028EBEDF0|nr:MULTISPECIES: response regulator [unclassified Bradyrhizobium]